MPTQRISGRDSAEQLGSHRVALIDVCEPMAFARGDIASSSGFSGMARLLALMPWKRTSL